MSARDNRSAIDRRRFADAEEATLERNCGTCQLRDRCRDPRKAKTFACASWMDAPERDDPSSRDFLDLMRDLVSRESVVPDKYAIDDRDAPLAPNSYEWNCGEKFLNFQPTPYPKQLEFSLKLFSDMCSFCRGPWYDDIPFDCDVHDIPKKVMLRRFGVCPRCGKSRIDGFAEGREVDYNTLVSVLGQRSGKSAGMSLIMSYPTHHLLKIKNPSAFYGIKSGTVLYNNVVGVTYSGAKQNVFDPLIAAMAESSWFTTYHQILDAVSSKRGEDELYKFKDTFLYYRTANLHISPSSPSRRSLRGRTRIGYAVDELGHFAENEKLVNISGLEVWTALSRSMMTIRPAIKRLRRRGRVHVPQAIGVAISSPYTITDPIMTLRSRALKARHSTTYTVLLPTWEANPDISFEDLQEEFDSNPVTAWRDYGCRPPFSTSAFVTGINSWRGCVKRDVLPYVRQRTVRASVQSRHMITVDLTFDKVDPTTPRILALDAGRTLNAFAACVAHVDERGRLVYDAFVEIQPQPKMPVNYELARENVLKPLIKNLGVVVAVSDRWQAYSNSDYMSGMGVDVRHRTLKYADFVAWRDDLLNGSFSIPRTEMQPRELLSATGPEADWLRDRPTCQLLRQSIIVVDVPGKTVEKPTEGNDDVFRTAVLAHACAQDAEVRELLRPTAASPKRVGAIGAAVTALGGTTTINNTTFSSSVKTKKTIPVDGTFSVAGRTIS